MRVQIQILFEGKEHRFLQEGLARAISEAGVSASLAVRDVGRRMLQNREPVRSDPSQLSMFSGFSS